MMLPTPSWMGWIEEPDGILWIVDFGHYEDEEFISVVVNSTTGELIANF